MTHHTKIVKFGWKPDPKDHRDKVMRFGAFELGDVPQKVDLRLNCSAVLDQSSLGSCTANATVGALEYLEIKDKVIHPDFENYSRLFVYYNTRAIQGEIIEDSGGTLRDAIKAVAASGACDERKWPYDIETFTIKPSDDCYIDAANHKITEYHRLETFPDQIKCLAEGYPFVFGFMIYNGFMTPEVARTGILKLPSENEVFQGGHAVCAVGYDMETRQVLVRNSWGPDWGQGGYFSMPFAYISNPALAQDFWTVRR
jgi:C1A family cysteine protease